MKTLKALSIKGKKETTKETSDIVSCFRSPRTETWELLEPPKNVLNKEDDASKLIINNVTQTNETLKNTLLKSLQMQNLVVLAGSGCSYEVGGPSMNSLWSAIVEGDCKTLAKSVSETVKYDLTKGNIEAFLSQVEAASFLQNQDVDNFLNYAKKIILEKMTSFLNLTNNEKLEAHETFLRRLSRRRIRDKRLRVFTTNYDLCFEQAASNINCVVIDGFSFTAPRRYDPKYFDYDIVRRSRSSDDNWNYLEGVFLLYKLHGSVNWEKMNNDIIENKMPDPQKACIIYPAKGKYQESYSQPYIESISQYLASLRESNTCVLVMGFGFNDDHLSEPLLSAIRSNPSLRLIIIDPFVKENAEKEDKNIYLKKLLELSFKGEDIWFINDTFNGFAYKIPDLKTLTPAERLYKELKGVMQ